MAAEEAPPVHFTSTAKATSLVDAISDRNWAAALRLTDLARNSLAEAAQLDPFQLALEVRCSVKGQAPWQIKLKTRAERCTGVYEPVAELVNGRPCYKKVGSDKDGDGQVWLCYTSNGPGHERYMIQHVRVKGHSKGYARCKLTDSASSSGVDGAAALVVPAPHQVALWQVHDGIDWSVCEDFVVLPVLPIPLLAALDHAQPSPRAHSLALPADRRPPPPPAGSLEPPPPFQAASWSAVPHALWASVVGAFLSDRDLAKGLAASPAFAHLMSSGVAQRPQWQVVAAVVRADPKASECRTRSGELPRDVACAKGAPFEVLDGLVRLTPYGSIDEAVARGAHRRHVQAMVSASPLARGLETLGFGAVDIGRLMADRSLGLVAEADLTHLRYDELVRAGVTAVSARKAMARLATLEHDEQHHAAAPPQPQHRARSPGRGGGLRAEDDVGAPSSPPPPQAQAMTCAASHGHPQTSADGAAAAAAAAGYWGGDAALPAQGGHHGGLQGHHGGLQGSSLRRAGALSSSAGGHAQSVAALAARLVAAEALSAERHAALAGQLELLARHSVEAARRETALAKQVQALTEALARLVPWPPPATGPHSGATAATLNPLSAPLSAAFQRCAENDDDDEPAP